MLYRFFLYILFTTLGFVSGLPLSLLTSTLAAWVSSSGGSVWIVGMLSMLTLPYALKPLFAVVIDIFRNKGNLSYQRVFIFAVLFLTIILWQVSYLDPLDDAFYFVFLMLCACFSSSIIDIAVDGMRLVLVENSNQIYVSTFYINGYRVGCILSGGMALVWAQYYGWMFVYQLMCFFLFVVSFISISLLFIMGIKDEKKVKNESFSLLDFKNNIITWFNSGSLGFVVVFALFFKFHEYYLSSLLPVYLLDYLHMDLAWVGFAYKTLGLIATICGGFIASFAMKRFSLKLLTPFFVLMQALSTIFFIITMFVSGFYLEFVCYLAVLLECLSLGMSSTALVVILASLCDKRFAALQFSLLTALLFACRSFIGPFASLVHLYFSWFGFFVSGIVFLMLPLYMVFQPSFSKMEASFFAEYRGA